MKGRRLSARSAAFLLLLLASVPGCRHPMAGLGRAPLDLQAAALDFDFPYQRFDGEGGSMSQTDGWSDDDQIEGQGEAWLHYAWTISREASVQFVAPPGGPFDFFAQCAPFVRPGGPPQTVSVELGGWRSAPVELRPDWQTIRIPLDSPASEPAGRLATLKLHFATLASPAEFQQGSDTRTLAVAFHLLALVPRAMPDPLQFFSATFLDRPRRTATLPPGGAFTIPIPAATRVRIHLGSVEEKCGGCAISVERFVPGASEPPTWEGRPRDAANRVFTVANDAATVARVRIRAISLQGPQFDPRRSIRIKLPEDFIRFADPLSARPGGEHAGNRPPSRPNVFIYLIDTMRADDLSLYGSPRRASPRIDEFARDAVTYRDAHACSSWTLPSTASILTGALPHRHRLMTGDHGGYAPGVPVLASEMRSAGYQTVGISQSFLISPPYGLDEGFGTFFLRNCLTSTKLRSQTVRRRMIDWLTAIRRPGSPIFAFVHTVDPHAPYSPEGADLKFARKAPGRLPESEYIPAVFMAKGYGKSAAEVAHLRALYDGGIRHADAEFGRFLDLLKLLRLYQNSLIVLVSDHGEEFGDHGGFGHGRTMFEELLHVPLVVRFPAGRWSGTSVTSPVSLLDLAPTILDAAGIDRRGLRFDGQNLSPPDAERADFRSRILRAETHALEGPVEAEVEYESILLSRWKCIYNARGTDRFSRPAPRWAVYDLASDPGEKAPLPTTSAEFARAVEIFQKSKAAEGPDSSRVPARANHELLELLRSLGYLR